MNQPESFDVINPFSGEAVGKAPNFSSEQIAAALNDAHAFLNEEPAEARAALLNRVSRRLLERSAEIARLISSESGLALKDTRHEVERAANVARFAAMVALSIEQDVSPQYQLEPVGGGPRLQVTTEPLDLSIAITPFNHPLNQVAHKVFPAIAAGTAMVLKPSEKTPLSALWLRELLLECGLDPTMLPVVTGLPAERVVRQLVADARLDVVTFTGGLLAGKRIAFAMAESGNLLKRFIPELGGCSTLIVHQDADLDKSLKVALSGCFANSGQRCTAIRRLVVVGEIAEPFLEGLKAGTENIRYGDPLDSSTDMGTLINEDAARQVEGRVTAAIRDGAKLVCGHIRRGALYAPTVLDQVSLTSELVAEETFGPVASVIRVENIEAAIQVARSTPYRLAGAIMTRDPELAKLVSDSLVVGQFNWNGPPSYRTEAAPFGGFGDSGNGIKEGVVLATQALRRIRTFYEH